MNNMGEWYKKHGIDYKVAHPFCMISASLNKEQIKEILGNSEVVLVECTTGISVVPI